MHKLRLAALAVIGIAAVAVPVAYAAGLWSLLPIVGQPSSSGGTTTGVGGQISGTTIPAGPPYLTGNEMIPADTLIGGGAASPQSVRIPVTMLGNWGGTPRNWVDNGAMAVQQRATGTITCAVVSAAIASVNYGPDRWGCIANVTTGVGRTSVITTAAQLPAGFAYTQSMWRASGALTQPICSMQEIQTLNVQYFAGQTVTLSFYATALAGLAADNNNVINAYLFTGTGVDQGFGTFTASPAITPAWTNISSSLTQAYTITTTPTRYSMTVTVPATATEAAVALCFTPTATGSGTTDGFSFTGVQLEVGASATSFEFKPYAAEYANALRYGYHIFETAGAGGVATMRGSCTNLTSSIANCIVPFPVPMRAVPLMTYATGFGIAVAAQTSMT